jgi:hypothetical protein
MDEPNPYRSYSEKYTATHSLSEIEQFEIIVLHFDLIFKPIWVLALSPMFFDFIGIGNYLFDDSDLSVSVFPSMDIPMTLLQEEPEPSHTNKVSEISTYEAYQVPHLTT